MRPKLKEVKAGSKPPDELRRREPVRIYSSGTYGWLTPWCQSTAESVKASVIEESRLMFLNMIAASNETGMSRKIMMIQGREKMNTDGCFLPTFVSQQMRSATNCNTPVQFKKRNLKTTWIKLTELSYLTPRIGNFPVLQQFPWSKSSVTCGASHLSGY